MDGDEVPIISRVDKWVLHKNNYFTGYTALES